MRVRVLGALLICSLAAVIAVIVPALEATSRDRTQQLVLSRSGSLDRLVALAGPAIDSGETTALVEHAERYVQLYTEPVIVLDSVGDPVADVGDLDADDPAVRTLAAQATRNLPHDVIPTIRPWSDRYHLLAVPINAAGDATGAVLIRVDAQRALNDVRQQWLLILAGAVAAEALLVGLALALTRWVLRPVRRLDDAATSLAHGDRPPFLAVSGPPELRRLALSFSGMAETVTATLDQQRRLIADSSHQLRNPLAAIRLRVDGLGSGSGVEPARTETYRLMTDDLDRLEHTVDKLLVLAEADHRVSSRTAHGSVTSSEGGGVPMTDLFLDEVLARWVPLGAQAGVSVRREGPAHLLVRCTAADLHDMLDSLLDNALKYAGRGARVTLSATTRNGSARLEVADDGPGLAREELPLAVERFWRAQRPGAPRGTGLGLAIVAQLARANNGEVSIGATEGGGLTVQIGLVAGVS